MMKKKKSKLKPGQLVKAFDFKVDKKDYIRSMAISNDEKLLYVSFAWNKNIRVFNVRLNKEESTSISCDHFFVKFTIKYSIYFIDFN
jgi:hypothetical protein